MTAKDIGDLLHVSPFKPFRLHLADGKNLIIPHPDFILPGNDLAVVAGVTRDGRPGELNFVAYEHIVRVESLPRRNRKAA